MKFNALRFSILLMALSLSTACSKKKSSQPTLADRISPYYKGTPERALCGAPKTVSNPVTITGLAQFQARKVYFNSLSDAGLGAPGTAQPIRGAEIEVVDVSGNILQCAETQADGTFSLTVSRSSGLHQIRINSRSQNTNSYASILNRPEKSEPYKLTQEFTPNQSKSLGTLTALATGDVLGGAFNILDQIYQANVYLKSQTANCATDFPGCQPFSPTKKVTVFWEKGFNPNSYFNQSDGISFYLPDFQRLFILGGINGDTDNSDTDHFDNSIILHEYGHFLEDVIFKTDSPGGPHYGTDMIDPRLAWSEGWGNFLQAAIRNEARYADTMGNVDGQTRYIFYVNLEAQTNDVPTQASEGAFREFSVTRLLWDAIDDTPTEVINTASDDIKEGFDEIWAALTKSTQGFLNSNVAFRDAGLFHLSQTPLSGLPAGQDWVNIRTIERQPANRTEYAQKVTATGACGSLARTIQPASLPLNLDSGSLSDSDLLRNNDFFHFVHSGGDLTLVLNYQTTSGNKSDIDLYVYKEEYIYADLNTRAGDSRALPSNCSNATIETETLSLPGLPAGNYLINVQVNTQVNANTCNSLADRGGDSNYDLLANGTRLCDANLF